MLLLRACKGVMLPVYLPSRTVTLTKFRSVYVSPVRLETLLEERYFDDSNSTDANQFSFQFV